MHKNSQGANAQLFVDGSNRPNSIVSREVLPRGSSIMTAKLDRGGFANFLRSFPWPHPIYPPIYHIRGSANDPRPAIISSLEDSLGHYGKQSVDLRISSYEKKISELQSTIGYYQDESTRVKQLNIDQQKSEAILRQQLRQIQSEDAFLRSQIQAQDSLDQEAVVKGLTNLNNDIEDMGRSVSEHVVENWLQDAYGKPPDGLTTLDAQDLPGLKLILQHKDGKSSLVVSSSGLGLGVEEFFDFSIRALLCTFLTTKIFEPLHPYLDLSDRKLKNIHEAFNATYQEVQKQGNLSIYPTLDRNCNLNYLQSPSTWLGNGVRSLLGVLAGLSVKIRW